MLPKGATEFQETFVPIHEESRERDSVKPTRLILYLMTKHNSDVRVSAGYFTNFFTKGF